MSLITLQCRLVANEDTRRLLWLLMVKKYTPLINELLQKIAKHDSFDNWCQTGTISLVIVKEFCKELRQEARFAGQSGRFYTSALKLVHRIYKSWLALQARLKRKIAGQTRWLAILQSDDELTVAIQSDLSTLQTKAREILAQIRPSTPPDDEAQPKKARIRKQSTPKNKQQGASISSVLFRLYEQTQDDVLTRCAIVYLLKNGCRVPAKPEDHKRFAKCRRKAEIRLERLMTQFQNSRLPNGRDLSDQTWLEALALATTQMPEDEKQAADWQASLLTKAKPLPFPVNYETNEDLHWFLNDKGRLCVRFNGISEHTFEIYCDTRQLHWFKRFLEDQEIKKTSKGQHSSGLFTLRTGRIAWRAGFGKGDPWNQHHLELFCAVDTRLWTAEGTAQVCQEKATAINKIIKGTRAKGHLNQAQEAFLQRRETTLALLDNPFPRPTHPLYQGDSNRLLGVSFGLDKPATVAIIDGANQKVITYRSVRQLLGENYQLLNRYRLRQQRTAHKRHNSQRKAAPNQHSENGLGEYVDRLLAQAIVKLAKEFQVSSLVLPDVGDVREVIQSEVQTRAEQKHLGSIELQRQYALQYRASVHRWSYARLSQNIQSQAGQIGIAIEIAKQPFAGTPQEKAKGLAISAYQSRK